MIHVHKILFPTDFSETSSAALGHALMLADRFNAALTMLHVASSRETEQDIHFPQIEPDADEVETFFEQQLAYMIGVAPAHKLQINRAVRYHNDPTKEISAYAEANHTELIIMGTHGRTGLSHWLMGSVAEHTVRVANCPVMTVRAFEESAEVTPYLDVLVPIDFSPYSQKALRYGRTLAHLFEATLHLLHVVDLPAHPAHYGLGNELLIRLSPEVQRQSREEMELLIAKSNALKVNYQTHVREGRAYSEIVRFAQEQGIDLIVMGTHGLSGLEHFLLGGTTEKVIRHALCPVMAIKLKERDFVEDSTA
jgi:nucleotide-binding universal stress UspA family protein